MGRDDEFKVPKGFRFSPTEEEIINFYLRPKIMGEKLPCNIVEEEKLYSGDPWKVLDDEKQWQVSEAEGEIREKTIYIFTKLTKKARATCSTAGKMRKNGGDAGGKEKIVRAAGCGSWDAQTGTKEIKNGKEEVIGFKRMLVFEIRDSSAAIINVGHWIMHEYSLLLPAGDESEYVLCEITQYLKKKPKRKRTCSERKLQSSIVNMKLQVRTDHGIKHDEAASTDHGIERPLAIQYPGRPIQVFDYKFAESLSMELWQKIYPIHEGIEEDLKMFHLAAP